jgi:hypothetical protein
MKPGAAARQSVRFSLVIEAALKRVDESLMHLASTTRTLSGTFAVRVSH